MWNHNIFHMSQLDRYTPPVSGQLSNGPHLMIVNDLEHWDVHRIFDSKQHYRTLHYLIQWAGYRYFLTSWEPVENLGNAQELVDEFRSGHPGKRRWSRKAFILACFSFYLSCILVIGYGPGQMALALVLPHSDNSRVAVEVSCVPYPPDDCGICFTFVCLAFECEYAAQEGRFATPARHAAG